MMITKFKIFESHENYIMLNYVGENNVEEFKNNLHLFKHYEMDTEEWFNIDYIILQMIYYDRINLFKILFDYDKSFIDYKTEGNLHIFYKIISSCATKTFNYYLDNNLIDINMQNDDGDTPLIFCAYKLEYNKNTNIYIKYIEKLIDCDADWDIKNYDDKMTFVEKLEKTGYLELLKIKFPNQYKKYLMSKKANEFNL